MSRSEGRRPVGALLQLIPLRMLASSGMSKLVFMILVLYSTFVWVRSVPLLAGSSLRILRSAVVCYGISDVVRLQ